MINTFKPSWEVYRTTGGAQNIFLQHWRSKIEHLCFVFLPSLPRPFHSIHYSPAPDLFPICPNECRNGRQFIGPVTHTDDQKTPSTRPFTRSSSFGAQVFLPGVKKHTLVQFSVDSHSEKHQFLGVCLFKKRRSIEKILELLKEHPFTFRFKTFLAKNVGTLTYILVEIHIC